MDDNTGIGMIASGIWRGSRPMAPHWEQTNSLNQQSLRAICSTVYFPQRMKIQDDKTRRQYAFALDNLAAFLGREPLGADLTDAHLAGMMRMLSGRGLAARTVNDRRGRIVALWNWLARRGLVGGWPTVERMTEPRHVPRAWRADELARLWRACRDSPGIIGLWPAADWWLAFHWFAWWTGERCGAILALEYSMIDWERAEVYVPARIRKGQACDMCYVLCPEAMAALQRLRLPERKVFFAKHFSHGAFYRRYTTLLKRAGLPTDRTAKPHRLRVSHASWVEAMGADATADLGHSQRQTTQRSYLDPSIVRRRVQLFDPAQQKTN